MLTADDADFANSREALANATRAIDAAIDEVREGRTVPVPVYLRDPNSSPLTTDTSTGVRTKQVGNESYEYSHNAEGGVTGQDYLGVQKRYYEPGNAGEEAAMAKRLEEIRAMRRKRRT